jgi:Carboxylesterase type B
MVWIHGGGFNRGSGNTEVYGPEFLVAEDVVIVTINYRVGPFGNYLLSLKIYICVQLFSQRYTRELN